MMRFNVMSLTTQIKHINNTLVSCMTPVSHRVEMLRSGGGKWRGVGTSRNWQSIPGPSWNIKFYKLFLTFLVRKVLWCFPCFVSPGNPSLWSSSAKVSNLGRIYLKMYLYNVHHIIWDSYVYLNIARIVNSKVNGYKISLSFLKPYKTI